MHEHEVTDTPLEGEPQIPLWSPPPPPTPTGWEQLTLVFERFGFLMAAGVTVLILAVLFIYSDLLLRQPNTVTSQDSSGRIMQLTIVSTPPDAAVFIDGGYVGISPVQDHTLSPGTHQFSLQKQDFAVLDTSVTLDAETATLRFALQPNAGERLTNATDEMDPTVAAAADQRVPTTASSLAEATVPADPSPPLDDQQTQQAPDEAAVPASEESELADVDLSVEQLAEQPALEQEEPPLEDPVVGVGELQIRSQPSGASVWLADQQVGMTPVLLTDLEAGSHAVTLRLEGYEPFTTTVSVAPQQRSEINGQLMQPLGSLKILAKPWGNIYIDGKLHKRESNIWYRVKLPPGNHRVRVEHPSLGKWEQVIVVTTEQERSVTIDFNTGRSSEQ